MPNVRPIDDEFVPPRVESGRFGNQLPMIGYYVHHHGSGHSMRYEAIAPFLGDVVPISELELAGGVRLPSDVPCGVAVDPGAGGALHWAPLHRGAATRLLMLADWLAERQPVGVIVDVSVETALTCRLAGVPTIVVRHLGRRVDVAHELGYRVASRLMAPWPRELEDDLTPTWIRDNTEYVGYITDEMPRPAADGCRAGAGMEVAADDVVVLWGGGGGRLSGRAVNAIAASCSGTVHCIGRDIVGFSSAEPLASNVSLLGWRGDVDTILRGAPITIASAGNNVVAAAARWGCPLVLVPQDRPFGEQHAHARRLGALGAAVVVDDPDAERDWSARLDHARTCARRLGALYQAGAARRAAESASDVFGCPVSPGAEKW